MRQRATRDTQTQVKHELMAAYLLRWACIIIKGLARQAAGRGRVGFQSHLIYLDTCSYRGTYSGDTGDWLERGAAGQVLGSPLLGIKALDDARSLANRARLTVETTAILFEQDPVIFAELVANLQAAGHRDRLVINPPTIEPLAGRIIVVNDNYLAHGEHLLDVLGRRHTFSFALLDPYGPTGIPYAVVSALARLPHADVMLNLPMYDWYKKTAGLRRGLAVANEAAMLTNYDAMCGTSAWRGLADEHDGQALEDALVAFYGSRLRAADRDLVVKHIRLQFKDRDRTMYYLFILTHDVTGALTLNEVIEEAELAEYELRWHYRQARAISRRREAGQLALFGPIAPPAPDARVVDIVDLADAIWAACAGRQLTCKGVLAEFANDSYFIAEIHRALRRLRREGKATFTGDLFNATLIQFVPRPAAPAEAVQPA